MGSQQRAILLGALVTGLLATVFSIINPDGSNQVVGIMACCLPALLGPLTAVWNYTTNESLTIPTGEGAKMGFLAGAGGALISGILGFLLRMVGVLPSLDEIGEMVRERLAEQGLPPESAETALKMTETFMGPLGIVIGVVIMGILGAIVGMIGAAIFKKGEGGVV